MTSSIPAARIALCDLASPLHQRNASTRFDLPQPFGRRRPSGRLDQEIGRLDERLEADQTPDL